MDYTATEGRVVLDPRGPINFGNGDYYAGWTLNGVSQGTGVYGRSPSESEYYFGSRSGWDGATQWEACCDPKTIALRDRNVREGTAGAIGGQDGFAYDTGAFAVNAGAWASNRAFGTDFRGVDYYKLDEREKPMYVMLSLYSAGRGVYGLYNGGRNFIGGLLRPGSELIGASEAAFVAARNVDTFSIPSKHLANAVGSWAKFNSTDVMLIRKIIAEALSSPNATFIPNARGQSFVVVTNLGRQIGTKGQTSIKIVVGETGKIWTAYPVN